MSVCTIRLYEKGISEPIQTITIEEKEFEYGKINAIIDDIIIKLERLRGSELLPYFSRRKDALKKASLLRKAILDDLERIRYILTAVFVGMLLHREIQIDVYYDVGVSDVKKEVVLTIEDGILGLDEMFVIARVYKDCIGTVMSEGDKLVLVFGSAGGDGVGKKEFIVW